MSPRSVALFVIAIYAVLVSGCRLSWVDCWGDQGNCQANKGEWIENDDECGGYCEYE